MDGLAKVLPKTFGYYIAQIGGPIIDDLTLSNSNIHNHIFINPNKHHLSNNKFAIQCKLDELPFIPGSIDTIIILHTLEFIQKPLLILKEIYDSLIDGGYIIIFSFNPYSLWGAAKALKSSQENSIWSGNWLTPNKLRHLLYKAGFSVGDYQTFYFRPPTENTMKMLFMEGMGQIFWPYCGASYMYAAQKKQAILTPIDKLKSSIKHPMTTKELLKPTQRATRCKQK